MIIRSLLFGLLLGLGLTVVLLMDEQPGLALVDLSNTPVQTVATGAGGEVLYAVSDDPTQPGLYRSEDKGESWHFAGSGPGVSLTALAVHPTNQTVLFAGSKGGRISETNNLWRSEDGGQSWRKFFLSLPAHPDGTIPTVTALAADPNRPEVLYVGTEGQGVYRFDVGPEGYGYSLVGNVAFHDMHIKELVIGADSQIYILTTDSLFSSNNGDTWRKLAMPPEFPIRLDTATMGGNKLYAMAASGTVYRSSDGGQHWVKVGGNWWTVPETPLRGTDLAVDSNDPDHVIISTAYEVEGEWVGGNIYETHNAGRNWAKVADLHGVARQLVLDDEAIDAVVPTGVIRYREPVAPPSGNLLPQVVGINSLSLVQFLALMLTLALGIVILLGRLEWFSRFRGK